MKDNIITISQAHKIFKEITGKRKSLKVLTEEVHQRPHLALFDFDAKTHKPRFLGVRRDRFIYFVKARLAVSGGRHVFHSEGLYE